MWLYTYHSLSATTHKANNKEMPNMKYLILFPFFIVLGGCSLTEGNLKLKGKIIDNATNAAVVNRTVLVLTTGTDKSKFDSSQVIGKFRTDTAGCFSYTLLKVKNVVLYNFYVVGDTSYASSDNVLGLYELIRNEKFLSFKIRKLTDLKIKIVRICKIPENDALYLNWKSDGMDGATLYPGYRVINGFKQSKRLEWSGGRVNSEVKTKVYAGEKTIVCFKLFRDWVYKEFVDTVLCLPDVNNSIVFKY